MTRFLMSLFVGLGVLLTGTQHARSADADPVVGDKKLSEWIADLKSGDMKKAFAAANAFGVSSVKAKDIAPAAPALIAQLNQKDNFLVYLSMKALEKIGADALPALLDAAKGKDEKISGKVIQILREHHPEASEKAGYSSIKKELAEMAKLDAKAELKGTSWLLTGVSSGKGGITSSGASSSGSSVTTIQFQDKAAEWSSMPYFQEKPGKATYTTEATKTLNRIEMRIGDDVYKGIYTIKKDEAGHVGMTLEMIGPGGDYPEQFTKDYKKFPKNVSMSLIRVK